MVSFNWDTIADTTLEYLKKSHLQNYISLIADNKRITDYYHVPLFLKLHGSLNWVICKNRKCDNYNKNIFLRSSANDLSHIKLADYQKCSFCGELLEINIIPPYSEKIDIHKQGIYSNQWRLARKKFQKSHRIVFIGYSFPTTDFYSEWLFRQINYLLESRSDLTKFIKYEIEVVNPETNNPESPLCRRYNSIFKGHNITFYNTLENYSKVNALY